MNKKMFFLLGATVAVLGGCTLAPTYNRPDAPIPAEWPKGAAYSQTRGAADAPQAAQLKWQEFIADGRLRQVIETALNNNRDQRLAALNVERARALYGIQRAELFPAFNAGAGANIARTPGDLSSSGRSATNERYDVNLGISAWEIDFFGRIRSLKDRALEEYLATEEAQRSVQILLVSAVAEAYHTLAANGESLKLAEFTLEAQKADYDLIQKRYEHGIASGLDLRQAQTRVEAARREIARFTQITAQAENALTLLVGASIPDALLPKDLGSVAPPREIASGTFSEVLLGRPDIMAGEHRLKAASANIGAARAALFPRISLTSAFGTASSELSGLFKSGSEAWSFAPHVTMPIFDARLWSAYDATKIEQEIALAQYEKAIQAAFREVADVLAVRGTVDNQLTAQQTLVDATAETFRLATARYEKGLDSYLGVLDAQRSLYAAQQGLISIRLLRLTNLVKLYTVLGGGA
ncbi:MAG: efflux transporter outer membrane subunit [Thermodesulfobacteriota bacterium]